MHCDLCNSSSLDKLYRSNSTQRNLDVYECSNCGLIQSWPRLSGIYKSDVSVTSGAGWGYIRYGKEQRLNDAVVFITSHLNKKQLASVKSILDVGSNRGHFLEAANDFFQNAQTLIGLEPHLDTYNDQENNITNTNVRLYCTGVEEFVSSQKFQFIYCSHTLEHVNSARTCLERIYTLLDGQGHAFIEVPNVEYIRLSQPNEFFIDNHLYHFDINSLSNLLSQSFLSISSLQVTDSVIRLLCTKQENSHNESSVFKFVSQKSYVQVLCSES